MKTIIVAVAAWTIGAALGFFLAWATVRYLRRQTLTSSRRKVCVPQYEMSWHKRPCHFERTK